MPKQRDNSPFNINDNVKGVFNRPSNNSGKQVVLKREEQTKKMEREGNTPKKVLDSNKSTQDRVPKSIRVNINTTESKRATNKSLIMPKDKNKDNMQEKLLGDERRVNTSKVDYTRETKDKDLTKGKKKPRFKEKAEESKKAINKKIELDEKTKKATGENLESQTNASSRMFVKGALATMIDASDGTSLQGAKKVYITYKNSRRALRYSATTYNVTKHIAAYGIRILKTLGSKLLKALTSKVILVALPVLVIIIVSVVPIIAGMGIIGSLFGWLYNDPSGSPVLTLTNYERIIDNQVNYDSEEIDKLVNPAAHGDTEDFGAFIGSSDTQITVNYKEVLSVLIALKIKKQDMDSTTDLFVFSPEEILDALTYFYTWTHTTISPYYCTSEGLTCYCPGHRKTSSVTLIDGTTSTFTYIWSHPGGCTCDGHHKKHEVTLENKTMDNVMSTLNFDENSRAEVEIVLAELDTLIAVNIPSAVESFNVNGLGYAFPLPTVIGCYITSPYGYRTDPVTGVVGAFHHGTDLSASGIEGQPIISVLNNGRVIKQGYNTIRGNYAEVKYSYGGQTITVIYMHMIASKVKVGDRVNQGDVIGGVGSTGKSTGPHLHIGIKAPVYVDPWLKINPTL